MALDNFRKVNITLNKANQRVLETQIAKAGDVNGRELVVQITNNGVIEDQTGTTLKLNWQHENGNQDSTNFKVVDIKTGLFSVYYPKEMLYKGKVDASIEIISNGQTTNSMNFKIIVQADVFNGEAGTVNGVFISLADVNKKLDDREKEYVELKERQTTIETQFNSVQQDLTNADINSAPEIIAARNYKSQTFETLSERLNYIQDGMISVNVKNFGAKGDGLTDDTEAVKRAIAFACSFAKGTGWKEEVPSIKFPAGKYIISEPQALNPTVSALRGYNISGEGYLNTIIKYTYTGTETDNHLMVNGGKSWWGFSYIQDISFEGNNDNNIWCIKSMNGSPQANRFLRVNFRSVNKAVTVLYGSANANADLFRFESCKASSIHGWVFGIDSAQNSQSIVHSFVNCDFETVFGRILYFRSGGEVSVIGGSWIVTNNGRIIECSDSTGGGIGAQNNQFTFYGTKFEWQGSANRSNDETFPLSYSHSYASILFYRCNFGQYTNAISQPHVFSEVRMGELIFEKCNIPHNMQVKLTKGDSGNFGYYNPSLLLDGCKVSKPLDQIALINITGGTANNIKWFPVVRAINCTSTVSDVPIDVDLHGVANGSKGISNTKKIFRYAHGATYTVGLPNATKTLKLPVGSTLTKIYVYAPKVGGNGYTYNYTFKTSTGDILHTATFNPATSKGVYVSDDLYHVINSESVSNITLEVTTTSPVGAVGYIDFEYM